MREPTLSPKDPVQGLGPGQAHLQEQTAAARQLAVPWETSWNHQLAMQHACMHMPFHHLIVAVKRMMKIVTVITRKSSGLADV